MNAIKVSADEKRLARLAKFRKKAPKKPKLTASPHVLEGWISKYNDWAKDVKKAASEGKRLDKLKKEVQGAQR